MPRKPAAPAADPAPADKASADLAELRAEIDKLDAQIVDLLNRRAVTASQIGQVKAATGGDVYSAAREAEVVRQAVAASQGPLPEATLRAIFRELISGCRGLQKAQRVAFLGPEYSYSHLAALERFGEGVEYIRVGTIAAVFDEVGRRHADFGLVPLFNSTDGRIADTLECFITQKGVRICSEVKLRVHHNLMSNAKQTDIRRVYSKAQALSQCRDWLGKNLPHASLHPVASTADACQLVQTEAHAAAVASREAAVRYGLPVLFANIEDHPENETRFAVVALHDSGRTGGDKTAVMFQVPNKPGSLADVLAEFKQHKINLTWIESFPYRPAKGEYVFFVDFDGHADDARVRKVLKALEGRCDELTVLGSFPAAVEADG